MPPFSQGQRDLSGWKFGLLFVALLLAYAGIASCSIHAPFFVLDDIDELYLVRSSASWASLLGTDLYHFFRPVKNLLFTLFNWLHGHGGIMAARAAAVSIGMASACAVYGLCRRLLKSRGWALAATAIWLLSPTLVACTAWLSATNILLMTGLAAAALICHDLAGAAETLAVKPSKIAGGFWSVLALLCFSLALFTYEGAVSVIALFFAVDWYLHPARLQRRSTWLRYCLYGLALVAYLALRHQAQSTQSVLGGFSGVSPVKAAISSGYFTILHLGVWIWPFDRMAVIGGYYWGQVPMVALAMCGLLVLAGIVFSIRQRWRQPYLSLGIMWFLLAFAPMSNVLGFRNGPYCDSYIALASIGVAVVIVAMLRALWSRSSKTKGIVRVMAMGAAAALIGLRAAAAFEAAAWSCIWNNPVAAYEHSIRTFPQAFDAMTELAKLYEARGEHRKADELAAKSIALAPDRSGPYAVRAVVAEREGRIQDTLKWLDLFQQYTYTPFNAWAFTFEADIYANHLGQPERAEALYRQALASRPWTQDALRAAYELAYMQATQNHQAEAISLWEQLLAYSPNDSVLHWNLSIAYAQQGDQKRAEYHRGLAQGLTQPTPDQSAHGNNPR